jgi:sugar phosphate isomerase/epimerase
MASPTEAMRDFTADHRWLSINTATVRHQRGVDWPLPEILDACAARGVRAVSPWRDQVAAAGLQATANQLRALDIELSGYCRGGMFSYVDPAGRQAAREQVGEGVAALLEDARERRMRLAIEPLHPMYAADRACINTLEQALDVCDALDPGESGALGVAVDVYHVWWDPKLEAQIERAGARRLLALHVCDWLLPTTDLLNDRGMMGDGIIDLRRLRGWVEAQGFAGYSEVEIFSTRWWQRDGGAVLDTCIERHRRCV